MAETLIQKHMRILGCTEEEAKQVIEYDNIIDKDTSNKVQLPFDLTKEQMKDAKKVRNGKAIHYNFTARERKADTTKEGVIEQVFNFLVENGYANAEIVNKSKEISFDIGDENFSFSLTRHRKKK